MKVIQPKSFNKKKLTKFQKLKKELNSKELSFLMEAHNGLTAKIAESAGFKGIWASGLSISTALGVRDNNEASWTQILDVLEFQQTSTALTHESEHRYQEQPAPKQVINPVFLAKK